MKNANNFEVVKVSDTGLHSILTADYRCFSYTYSVGTFVVDAFGEIDYAWHDISWIEIFFKGNSPAEELAEEFLKAFEEHFKVKFYYKLQVLEDNVCLEFFKSN